MLSALAIDMGSSSLRAYLGIWDGTKNALDLKEIGRQPITAKRSDSGTLYWPTADFIEIARQFALDATKELGKPPDSVGVDGWGVDFAYVDKTGRPLGKAIAYRDARGTQGQKLVDRHFSRPEQYQLTGVLPQDINSVNRLALDAEDGIPEGTDSIMFLQDLVARSLAWNDLPEWGAAYDPGSWASLGIASTSGLMESGKGRWSREIVQAIGLDETLLPQLRGEPSLRAKRGETVFILSGSHDTACAAYAIAPHGGDIFVSCGSWAVVGATTSYPVNTEDAFAAGITNESATGGKNRAELNLTGMWLAQECRRTWEEEGRDVSFSHLDTITQEAQSRKILIDPSDPRLAAPGNMPNRIRELVKDDFGITGLTDGELLRLIDESLAAAIVESIHLLRSLAGGKGAVTITGGGTNDTFLMQEIASRLGQNIYLAKCEASIIGNVFAQLNLLGVPQVATRSWLEGAEFCQTVAPELRKNPLKTGTTRN